jgi:hypothetical protein
MLSDITTYYEDRNTEGTEKVGKEVELRTCYYLVRGPWSSMDVGHMITLLYHILSEIIV